MNEGLGSWTGRRRRKSGAKPAIIFDGAATTYAELDARAGRLAGAFAAVGVRSGDRVAYLGDNHPSFLECLFATAWLGAIFVPLNTRLAAPELTFILRDSGATILVTSAAHAGLGAAAATDSAVRRRLLAGPMQARQQAEGAEALEDLASADNPRPAERSVGFDDPALILYTSGTTGRSKGALLSHGNLTWNALNVLVDYDLTSTDRALMVSPLFHAASLGMGALPTLLKGATVVLEERFDPGRALRLIEQEKITFMSGVPTTFQMMCEHPDWATTDLGSLQRLTCGGSPVPLRVMAAFESRGLSFTGGYGMTEASPGATSLSPVGLDATFIDAGSGYDVSLPKTLGADGNPGALGPNSKGVLVAAELAPVTDDTPGVKEMTGQFDKDGTPANFWSQIGWISAKVFFEGLKQGAGGNDITKPEGALNALKTMQPVDTGQAAVPLTFGPGDTHAPNLGSKVLLVNNGDFELAPGQAEGWTIVDPLPPPAK